MEKRAKDGTRRGYATNENRTGESLERSKARAAAEGRRLDSLGRVMAGPGQVSEKALWTDPETGEQEWRERWVPREEIRCGATTRAYTSGWRGQRCMKVRVNGTTVCKSHGGALPNVIKAARRRLAMAADPAAAKLIYIALKKPGVSDADRIRALTQILDRAGVEGKTTVEIEVAPWQSVLQKVYNGLEEHRTIDGEVVEVDDPDEDSVLAEYPDLEQDDEE